MVSAACPKCAIYLIETNDNSLTNLNDGVAEAVKLGAVIVSNSWGCTRKGCTFSDSAFSTPGITYVAAAGDDGYGSYAPADFATVVAVGGTVLSYSKKNSKYTEKVWSDSAAGRSNASKPSWQNDPDCPTRMTNDVAAVAKSVAVYDTYGGTGYTGWLEAWGLAGNATQQDGGEQFRVRKEVPGQTVVLLFGRYRPVRHLLWTRRLGNA